MEAWITRQWQRNSLWQIFLRPVSWLFGWMATIRRRAFRIGILKSYPIPVPVIVVGNITVGGTGKTPLVLALVEALKRQGMHCGIVTRGYHLRSTAAAAKVARVSPTNPEDAVMSDEATLLARRSGVPVYRGRDRVDVARTLLRDEPSVDVIVSDDGLQHYAMRRDIEICVIDSARGLGNGQLLPAGPLREPASRLNRIDAIVVNRAIAEGVADASRFPPGIPAFDMTLANELFINLKNARQLNVSDALVAFQGRRLHALAGTGHPQRFFSHLASLGLELTITRAFPDHYIYRRDDLPGNDADVVLMTEKDAVKCSAFADERMWFMRVDAILSADFADFVTKKLSTRKA